MLDLREQIMLAGVFFWGGGITLPGINISHLGKRKIIFKMPFLGDMLVPWRVFHHETHGFLGVKVDFSNV